MLTDEMTTKSQLKKKLTESRINDDDLPISKVVSELINKYQQEKQVYGDFSRISHELY